MTHSSIAIIDFGSQYTQLIARRIRDENVYCEIFPCSADLTNILKINPKGIILSGGPNSVYDDVKLPYPQTIFELDLPILAICYGMQLMAVDFGGTVVKGTTKEYGLSKIRLKSFHPLLSDISTAQEHVVWMSHGDHVKVLPNNFKLLAESADNLTAIIAHNEKPLVAVQFHPEVTHTSIGKKLLSNFLFKICQCQPDWKMETFVQEKIQSIRRTVEDKTVVLGLSGGVDSTVAAQLIHKAIGNQLVCIFVNNGLLRLDEEKQIMSDYQSHFPFNLRYVDASEVFLSRLQGVSDPEKKRKIIGATFIDVFDQTAKEYPNVKFLGQGTLYPDVIESVSFKGPSVTIKSHHNVGGLPEKMNLQLIEPLRELFKDEVRAIGREMGIKEQFLMRHPFPGPGLAVRLLGDITKERLMVLKKADFIYIDELKQNQLYDNIWQALAVLLPVKSVGVMGDNRTYAEVLTIRAVDSTDGMTASCHPIPYEVLNRISTRIINEVEGINRVVYDISSKPPSTIEWE